MKRYKILIFIALTIAALFSAGAAYNIVYNTITARTSIELGSLADTTITRTGTGDIGIEGNVAYRAGGTDVPVADGGTGASTLTDGGVLLGSGTEAVTAMSVLTDGQFIVGDGTTDPVAESGTTARTSLGVAIGTNVQAWDDDLDDIAALTPTLGHQITGNGTDWQVQSKPAYDNRDYTNIVAAQSTLGTGPLTFVVSDVEAIDANTVIDPNWSVVVNNGGSFAISSGKTLSMNGPFSAGLYQAFSGDGTVTFGAGSVTDVPPQWWGAAGDNETNSTAAINKMVASVATCASRVLNVKFPPGIYIVDSSIDITGVWTGAYAFKGSGRINTEINASSAAGAIDSVIQVNSSGTALNIPFSISDIKIAGSNKAAYGLDLTDVSHTNVESVIVTSCTSYGVYFYDGWVNSLSDSQIRNNTNGIYAGGAVIQNILNITNCLIWLNTDIGIHLAASHNKINISGCTIEGNGDTGIFVNTGTATSITGNYFENNSGDGHVFTTPSVTVKAEIIVNGGESLTTLSNANPVKGVDVEDSFVASAASTTSFVYSGGCSTLNISNNVHSASLNPKPLLSYYNSATYSDMDADITTNNNANFTEDYDFTFLSALRPTSAINIKNSSVVKSNLANTNFLGWSAILGSASGTWKRSAETLTNHPMDIVWELDDTTTSSYYGYQVTDTDYPERAGKYYIFTVDGRVELESTSQGLFLYAGDGANTNGFITSSTWKTVAGMFEWTSSGATLSFGVKKLGADGSIYVANPVLYEVGAGLVDILKHATEDRKIFFGAAAPTAGTWKAGDIVIDTVSASGSPIGWTCTSAGAPGTWVAFGYVGTVTVTGLTLNSETLTLNTGALTLTPSAADSSVLTVGSGAVSVSGANTGDNTNATTVTITDNEDTAENNPLVFVAGGDLDGGNLGLESDGTTYYTPSTGTITATEFVGGAAGLTGVTTTLDDGDVLGLAESAGLVWADLGQQEAETYIYSLTYCGNGICLAGTAPNGKIFRSTDYGATWADLSQQEAETHVRSLVYCGNGICLAGTSPNGKIFRSTDYGATWVDLGQQEAETYVLSLAYCGNGICLAGMAPGGKIFRSTATMGVNQPLLAESSPEFNTIELGHATDTTLSRISAGVVGVEAHVRSTTSTYVRLHHVGLYGASPGASGATFVPPDANRTGGWQLNTATEYVYGESVIHGDWDGATDLTFEVHFTINTDNTGGAGTDTCDGVVEFYYKGDGENECKRQTVEGAKVIGAASQYTQFSIDIPLNWDLADNIVQVDDIIGLRFNLETDTSEVDDVTITNISLQYNTSHLGIEDGDI